MHNSNLVKFCVDDYGFSEGVNESVIELNKLDLVNYAAASPYGKYIEHASQISKSSKNLHIGLHLTLTDFFTNKISTLSPSGSFMNRKLLLKNIISGNIKKADLYNEVDWQLSYVSKIFGDIHFINSHQDVHIFPLIYNVVCDISKVHGIPVRNISLDLAWLKLLSYKSSLKYWAYMFNKLLVNKPKPFTDQYICMIKSESQLHDIYDLTRCIDRAVASSRSIEIGLHTSTTLQGLDLYWPENSIPLRLLEFNKCIELKRNIK